MRWQWLYRDFLSAFRSSTSDPDWLEVYTRLYLEPHRAALTNLHFEPKGFPTEDAVFERLRFLGRSRYRRLVDAIERQPDFERALQRTVAGLVRLLRSSEPDIPVHVIVGLHCTNIYTGTWRGETTTVLCLEAVDGDPDGLRLLLAHEAHHWARQAVLGPDILTESVGERLASEGLAIAFSRHACPGLAKWDYCFVPETTYRWVEAHMGELCRWMEPHLEDAHLMDALFSRTPGALPLPGMPPRTGYVLGYMAASAAAGNQDSPDFGVALPWRTALTRS